MRNGFSVACVVVALSGCSGEESPSAATKTTRASLEWAEEAQLVLETSSTPSGGAAVAVSGNTIAATGLHSARARTLVRTGTTWTDEGELQPDRAEPLAWAIAISNDTIVLGDPSPAAAIALERTDTGWGAQTELVPSGETKPLKFGRDVAIDGDTLVVGSDAEAAWVFVRAGDTWTEQAKLVAKNPKPGDLFGYGVAIDGDTIAIGAPAEEAKNTADRGAVYVFRRARTTWTQEARLVGAVGDEYENMGLSVAISGEVIVAASDRNRAHLFANVDGEWNILSTLVPPDGATGSFGRSVAISDDKIVVGATGDGAWLFVASELGFQPAGKLKAAKPAESSAFGFRVAVSGSTVVVGDIAVGKGVSAHVFRIGEALGTACSDGSTCQSGFCVDGVCCDAACGDGSKADCQACSVAAGALADGTCAVRFAGVTCRAAASSCDVEEECDGTSVTCAADGTAPDGTECGTGTCQAGVCSEATAGGGSAGASAQNPPVSSSNADTGDEGCRISRSRTGSLSFVALMSMGILLGRRSRRRHATWLGAAALGALAYVACSNDDPASKGGATGGTGNQAGADAAAGTGGKDASAPACGDGTVDDGEACDDGNHENADECRADCSAKTLTNTYLASAIDIEAGDDPLLYAYDQSGDGVISEHDNGLIAFQQNWVIEFGSPQDDLSSVVEDGGVLFATELFANVGLADDPAAEVRQYLAQLPAPPKFDGTDAPVPAANAFMGTLTPATLVDSALLAGPGEFVFPILLWPGDPVWVPIEDVRLRATTHAGTNLLDAKLSGTMRARAFAAQLPAIAAELNAMVLADATDFGGGTPVGCSADIDCLTPSAKCTVDAGSVKAGVCVYEFAGGAMALDYSDNSSAGNEDGVIDVVWDDATHTFTTNELSLVFTLEADGSPTGYVGEAAFLLDMDDDGIRDAMGLGMGLTLVGTVGNAQPDPGSGCEGTCGTPGCGTCPVKEMIAAGPSFIDSEEVSNAHYGEFLKVSYHGDVVPSCSWNTTYVPTQGWPAPAGEEALPVGWVDWCDAFAYCQWTGGWLCRATSANGDPALDEYSEVLAPNDVDKSEWYRACAGSASVEYPYGTNYNPQICNGADKDPNADSPWPVDTATCAGFYPKLLNMSGNISEWTDSCDGVLGASDECGHRGGSYTSPAGSLTCDTFPTDRRDFTARRIGFRCCGPAS